MYQAPRGWTNKGQKRGCFTLHPASDQARLVNLQEQNDALAKRLAMLEASVTTPAKTKKKGKGKT